MYNIYHFQQIHPMQVLKLAHRCQISQTEWNIFQAEVSSFMSCSLIDKNICTYICFVFNTDVITKIKNTFHTAGINSFSMYRYWHSP